MRQTMGYFFLSYKNKLCAKRGKRAIFKTVKSSFKLMITYTHKPSQAINIMTEFYFYKVAITKISKKERKKYFTNVLLNNKYQRHSVPSHGREYIEY